MAEKEIIVITGANTGIGFEAVKALVASSRSYHIFLGSRSLDKGQDAVAEIAKLVPETGSSVEALQIDVADDDSISRAVGMVTAKVDRIDALINNAGATFGSGNLKADFSNARAIFNQDYDVNVSGTHVTTINFIPLLLKSSNPRLIFLTSGLSTLNGHAQSFMPVWAPKPKAGWPKDDGIPSHLGYKASKAALNMVMLNWHWILKDDGVKTWAISPGFLATNLGGNKEVLEKAGAGHPSEGGDLLRRVVEGERDGDVGKVLRRDGEVQEW